MDLYNVHRLTSRDERASSKQSADGEQSPQRQISTAMEKQQTISVHRKANNQQGVSKQSTRDKQTSNKW